MRRNHFHAYVGLFGLVLAHVSSTPVAAQPPVYLMQWGATGSGEGQFNFPNRVAVDASGNVYVSDFLNNRIQKFTDTGAYVTQWNTTGASGFLPFGVATDASNNVYVVDYGGDHILKFTDTGTFLTQWGTYGDGDGQFIFPNGVATDAAGNVFVVDFVNNRVEKFTSNGSYLTQWGSSGVGSGQFDRPYAIATDPAGNVYVADYFNDRIQKFDGSGKYLTQWGSNGGANGQFYHPIDVATDAAGNIYVAENGNNRIQKFTNAGVYLTQWGSFGSGNGEFYSPFGLTVDSSGNIYVVDTGNDRIQKFGAPRVTMAVTLPGTLNLRSMGRWVTAYLQPPPGFDASTIDVGTIQLYGNVPRARPVGVDPSAPSSIGDENGDNVPDLMVKFDRAAIGLALTNDVAAPVAVTGMIAGEVFGGTSTLKVMRAFIPIPPAGTVLHAGTVTPVEWQTPPGVNVQSVALLWSLDDGASWTLEANGIPNRGSYDWKVPAVASVRARVAVVLVESADATGYLVDGVLGVSEAFSIDALVGVGDGGPIQLALHGVTPNPARRELQVSFSLIENEVIVFFHILKTTPDQHYSGYDGDGDFDEQQTR